MNMVTDFRRNLSTLTQTRLSNTGLNSQTGKFSVGIDWVDLTFRSVAPGAPLRTLLSDIEALTGDELELNCDRPMTNGKRWDGSGGGPKGTKLYWMNEVEDEQGVYQSAQLKVIMSGRVLAGVDESALACYLLAVPEELRMDCTRIDVALDDHEKFIDLWKIIEAVRAGNFFNASYTDVQDSGRRGDIRGRTIYFGSTKSDVRLRAYDKTIESLGRILGNRLEAQYRKNRAFVVLKYWLNCYAEDEESVPRKLSQLVLGVIDFRDRSNGDPNRGRCPALPWFLALQQRLRAEPLRIRAAVVVQSAQKTIDWIIDSVAPSLSTLKEILKEDFVPFISQTIADGHSRLNTIRQKIIANTYKEQLLY